MPSQLDSSSPVAPASAPLRARILIRPQWDGPAGIRAIFAISLPLILSNAVHAMNLFIDRTFLSYYSEDSFAASVQGGMLNWTLLTFFMQTVLYSGTLVAQYMGAGEHRRVGAITWQAVYLALAGGCVLAGLSPLGYPIFRWIGHEGRVPLLEAQFFSILCAAAPVFLMHAALSSFFSGQGRTMTVLAVSVGICTANVALDLWFIFGGVSFIPEGIRGAAYATILSSAGGVLAFLILIFTDAESRDRYGVREHWRPSRELMGKMFRYGLPAGAHGFLDMFGFTAFMMAVGRFGIEAHVASNMALNINLLLFIPAVGLHIGVSILMGQFCGAQRILEAERMVAGALTICMTYMLLVCIIYIGFPGFLIDLMRGANANGDNWDAIAKTARVLLLFVALFSTFDAIVLIYSGALKGAGDTKFVMLMSVFLSQAVLTWPSILLCYYAAHHDMNQHTALYMAWLFCSLYIIALGAAQFFRYRAGRWKLIRIVDRPSLGG